ncbi:MAG: lysine--tRNA ligase [Candidatus Riflebacteria bacterium]|nr:lysine--tRNA ligase [Candidatus Riflebacteria bacterium]
MSQAESWPHQEAQRILDRTKNLDQEIILQTGFGPSGFPHIGTFGEITRTTFVRLALTDLGAKNTRLIVFSDDMDGLRKVPLTFPAAMNEHLGKPLNEIPDPFGCCESYSGHMNGKLLEMLGRLGFDHEFRSSAQQYQSGVFNNGLKQILDRVDKVCEIILPTMSDQKRQGWSPFLPICESCRRLSTTRVTAYHPERCSVSYTCDGSVGAVNGCGHTGEGSILDGHAKVGWKTDWALRWYVYGVTYEMYGKDLIESANLSGKIVRALGGTPPVGYFFELFLDETGAKISKSVGKGVTVDSWLRYAPVESLALFMYRNPRRAKKLFLGAIPQYVDELLEEIEAHYGAAVPPGQRSTFGYLRPDAPASDPFVRGLRYGTLAELAGTVGTTDIEILSQYVKRGIGWPGGDDGAMKALISQAALYHREVLLPTKVAYTPAGEAERTAIGTLIDYLAQPNDPEEIQTRIFALAKESGMEAKDLFKSLYLVITGQERGPRLGGFITVLGRDKVREILTGALQAAGSR